MDSQFFRLPTHPNYYPTAPVDVRMEGQTQEFPAPDSRYPGWAAPMSDARLVTDYQPHCARNVPAGRQFPTKAWMQKNATDILNYNRKVFSERMGATQPFDASVVPPPALISNCEKGACSLQATGIPGGIGVERAGAAAPELFGTFSYVGAEPRGAVERTSLTTRYEGGRNSIRGVL